MTSRAPVRTVGTIPITNQGENMPGTRRLRRALVPLAITAGLLVTSSTPAGAAHEPGPEAICDGTHVTLWPNSGKWGVKTVRESNTQYIPVKRQVIAEVLTGGDAGTLYGPFHEAKGNGNAHPNQDIIVCTYTVHEHDAVDPFTGAIVDVDFHLTIWAVRKS